MTLHYTDGTRIKCFFVVRVLDDAAESKQARGGSRDAVSPLSAPATAISRQCTMTTLADSTCSDEGERALQVLEMRLGDWMTRNPPPASRVAWRRPRKPPTRITRLRRPAVRVGPPRLSFI